MDGFVLISDSWLKMVQRLVYLLKRNPPAALGKIFMLFQSVTHVH